MEPVDLLMLQILVREGLEELFPETVWVRAEIASIQVKSNGHCYLELCQSSDKGVVAKAKAIIWRNNYLLLSRFFREAAGCDLRPGISVLVLARVNYSELYGLSLVIEDIDPSVTLGEAELKRRRTVEQLSAEGLLDRQSRLEMAELPYRLAVISARDAAGYGDFRRHLDENEFGFVFDVTLFEAAMQGDSAPESISDALAAVEASTEKYDAVLILRGGGSALDLACFDDYGLCFSIANCRIPVLTAIGHDRDNHVADMVAFRSVKTPTALADVFIDAFAAEDERLTSYSTRLRLAFQTKISLMSSTLDVLESRIRSADPRRVLERGYSLVTGPDGVVRKKAAGLAPGDVLKIYFSDGEVNVKVQ
ncbi:MAG: exodeoxyribonuclease VII large subunit [Bacteroidales bacterium]|nr:exodeoxyribonuclease VII large subunit [Bacteroidales bacterium]